MDSAMPVWIIEKASVVFKVSTMIQHPGLLEYETRVELPEKLISPGYSPA
jgi:hypothetical protein